MGGFIIILGLLQIVGGVAAYSEAASAIHQILGAISFGMGILSIALGLAVNHLSAIGAATEQQLKIFGDSSREDAGVTREGEKATRAAAIMPRRSLHLRQRTALQSNAQT